jgi:hypothetical protein
MGIFSGIEKASSSNNAPWITPGKYPKLTVTKASTFTTRRGVPMAVVDFVNEDTGMPVSWGVDLRQDPAKGNIKGFISAAAGCAEEDVTEADAEEAYSDKSPLIGKAVTCEAFNVITRKGGDFTKCIWHSV